MARIRPDRSVHFATDRSTPAQTATITYTLPVQLDVGPKSLRQGHALSGYRALLSASGGSGPYVFEVSEGALAKGLSLTPPTPEETCAKLTGTPETAEKAKSTVTARDTGSGLACEVGGECTGENALGSFTLKRFVFEF